MTFAQWTSSIVGLVNTVVVPALAAIAALVFIWGVVNYFFLNSGNEEKRIEGRQFIIWGVLGMVLLFGVWGLVNLLLATLGFTA